MTQYLGEIRLLGQNWNPVEWALCNGQSLSISDNELLYVLIGTTYGGDGEETFVVPHLNGRMPVGAGSAPGLSTRELGETGGAESVTLTLNQLPSHTHVPMGTVGAATATSPAGRTWAARPTMPYAPSSATLTAMHATALGVAGGSQPHENRPPYTAVTYVIATAGVVPTTGGTNAEAIVGEIRAVAFNVLPGGWRWCDGSLLSVADLPDLFAVLGTAYGHDGDGTFALPDLRGRQPVHAGAGRVRGDTGGAEAHTLTVAELAEHTHAVYGAATATATSPTGNVWAGNGSVAFASTADTPMAEGLVSPRGGNQPHTNMAPFVALNFMIAVSNNVPT